MYGCTKQSLAEQQKQEIRRCHRASGRVDAAPQPPAETPATPQGTPGGLGSPGGGQTEQTENRGQETDPPRMEQDPLVQERTPGGEEEERESDMDRKRAREPLEPQKGNQGEREKRRETN